MAIGALAASLFILVMFLVAVIAILLLTFWIWMIVDCAKRKFLNENDKIIWVLIIVLASWIGAVIYYFVIKTKDKKSLKR